MAQQKIDLEHLTEAVKAVAREAGGFLRSERKSFDRGRVEQKAAHDYVSYVDKASERMIVARLHDLLPEAGFITEEGTGAFGGEEFCWLVDPLDGTSNYIHDNAPYCVSIALRDRKEVLLGVVYECCRDELFWACKDGKAYLNGEEIHVSRVSELLIDNMVLFFLPAAVGLITSASLISANLVAILVAAAVSTVLIVAAVAITQQRMEIHKRKRKIREGGHETR